MSFSRVLGTWLLLVCWTLPNAPAQAGHLDVTKLPSDGLLWTKEPGIRIEEPGRSVHSPYVFRFPDGTLRMYYGDIECTPICRGPMRSAVSLDGLTWTREPGIRLADVFGPHVLQMGGIFRMYFLRHPETLGAIGSATSSDGLNWVVEPGDRIFGVIDPAVVELPDGSFRMYFVDVGLNIGSAVSVDGLVWRVEPGARISNAREYAVVRLPDGSLIIYYTVGEPAAIAILSARSSDGLSFTLDDGPRLLPGPDPLDGGQLTTTSILQFPDGTVRMYYQASEAGRLINDSARVFSATATGLDNRPPDTSQARPSVSILWPPNHRMVSVSILGVTDPDDDPIAIEIGAIMQDEPANGSGDGDTCPDGQGIGTAIAQLRAERSGGGNGRVYTLFFTATDGRGGSTPGTVTISVPHDQRHNAVDDGPVFDSTFCKVR
jgi:hypothetical protein